MNPELVEAEHSHDIICPHCNARLKVEWEQDDPVPGEEKIACPACKKDIKFEVALETNYTVYAWQDPDPQ
jgi:uncharacterized protein YbaR (Trm112 family)